MAFNAGEKTTAVTFPAFGSMKTRTLQCLWKIVTPIVVISFTLLLVHELVPLLQKPNSHHKNLWRNNLEDKAEI
jgi:hypothetical protein